MSMIEFQKRFSNETACREFLEQVRWPHGPECPRCGAVGRAGRIRTRPGSWTCLECKKSQFTVTAGTPLHRTHLPLTKWFLAIWLITTSSKGVSGKKLAEWLEVDYKTAWFMGHRIRRMLAEPQWSKLSGIVEADEMYVGERKKPEDDDPGPSSGGSKRGRGAGRATVLVAVERDGGARAKRIATHSSQAVGATV
jgi:transposase-like protein